MKNIVVLRVLVVLGGGLVLSVFCGCERAQEMAPVKQPVPLGISMVYPGLCLGDMSYCDLLAAGIRSAEERFGIDISEVESSEGLWEVHLREAAEQSALVLTAGYQVGEAVQRVAVAFPDVKFAIIDSEVAQPNVASFVYNMNEGSFLVGSIAALKTETGKVGYIGGADVPFLHAFEAGYMAGVHAVNPSVEVVREYITVGPEGFTQPMVAESLAARQYESGVDIIYAAAGGAGQGIVEAAKAHQKYVIWADTNINATAPDIFLTSLLREINTAVYNIVTQFVAGDFRPGVHHLGIQADDIVYALDEYNRPHLSDAILMEVDMLKTRIVSGEIVVPTDPILPRE